MKVCNISISDQATGYHNGNSYTKHVYMDGERVATLLGSDNSLLDDKITWGRSLGDGAEMI